MKSFAVFLLLVLTGCQSQPPAPALPPKLTLSLPTTAPVTPNPSVLERKIRLQAQTIEALVSQNEALSAKLNAAPAATPVAPSATLPPLVAAPATVPVVAPTPERTVLLPNADGVIDVAAALVAAKAGEAVNPFAVRVASPEGTREVKMLVSGIVAGPTACAVINDRLLLTGDTIESLAVERIESDAVFLRWGEQRLRLPVSENPARVRLPL